MAVPAEVKFPPKASSRYRVMRALGRLAKTIALRPRALLDLPRFVADRGRSPIRLGVPFLPYGATRRIRKSIRPEWSVFEFGGGGSSLWFARQGVELITVEHDVEWQEVLRTCCGYLSNVTILFEPCSPDFGAYVASIDRFDDDYFDLVLVDGRERVSCVKHAISKVKPGGWLVLDDSARDRYRSAFALVQSWHCVSIAGLAPGKAELGQTTFWRKPMSGHGG